MQIGFIGLGRMGGNMVHRIKRDSDHDVVAFDRSQGPREEAGSHDVLAPPTTEEHGPGWGHFGPTGAGHYVKMVHNGVEYGMMQAYAEGFSLFDACEYQLDNAKIAHLWMQGSVVRSWLCELAARAFEQEGNDLANLEPYVEDSGEGRWTVEDAIDKRIPMPVISTSLFERFSSRGQNAFAAKVNAALRNQFGGHALERKGQPAGAADMQPAHAE